MSKSEVLAAAEKLTPFERSISLQATTEYAFTGRTTNGYTHDNKKEGVYVGAISVMTVGTNTLLREVLAAAVPALDQ